MPKRKLPRIRSVSPVSKPWRLKLVWDSDLVTVVDLSAPLGELSFYKSLRDNQRAFQAVELGEHGTDIVWANGLDMSADLLWQLAREQLGLTMSAHQFRSWREGQDMTLDGAAEALGISRRMIAYYESGEKPVPRVVALATRALNQTS